MVAQLPACLINTPVLSRRQELELLDIAEKLLQPGKGILAADEPNDQMEEKLKVCNLPNTPENRRRYRQLLFTTPNLSKHISGVILYSETYQQNSEKGERLVDLLRRQNIVVGIQVDQGSVRLTGSVNEVTTQGMDNLAERASAYKKGGCSFAKWRCAYHISENTPSHLALQENANLLARFASICQKEGLVPFVEPDVVCLGDHSIEQCQQSEHFVDPITGAHTNSIESAWQKLKARKKKEYGTASSEFRSYIEQHLWSQMFSGPDCFYNLMSQICDLYPCE
uniref:fructose-bisphosphate aldolase n=1 Tax=Ditylenchus dipsaci TaxID=166011 RepID=A0A915DHX5_9BILA